MFRNFQQVDGEDDVGDDPIYEACETDKTCFGKPDGCVNDHSCDAIVTVAVNDGQYEFELLSGVGQFFVLVNLSLVLKQIVSFKL